MSTRRDFLKTSLVLAAGGGVGVPLVSHASAATVRVDREVDVLIVGAGQAGLCAGIAAKEAGAKSVLVVEKAPACGGHTTLSGGGYWIGGTSLQREAGIDDSLEINWKDAVDRGIASNGFLKRDTAIAYKVYKEGIAYFDWLKQHGVGFHPDPGQGIGNRRRIHYFAPGYVAGSPVEVETLRQNCEKLGVEFLFNTRLVSLVTKSGRPTIGDAVVGAIFENDDGKKLTFGAKGGLILACGGYANNPEMVEKLHPYLKGVPSFGSPFNSGDGIQAALGIGANFIMEYTGFGFNLLLIGTHRGAVAGAPVAETPLIVVTKGGKRVEDESRGYLRTSQSLLRCKEFIANWIFDSSAYEQFKDSYYKIVLTRDVVTKYDSIEALADAEKIDKTELLKTLKKYNADAKAGKDSEFGRTKNLQPIVKAPFYSFECSPKIYTSYSGIEINTEAQVLTGDGTVIPGLYAAGDVCGHLAYQAGLGGGGISGLVMATVYGCTAGANAAKRA